MELESGRFYRYWEHPPSLHAPADTWSRAGDNPPGHRGDHERIYDSGVARETSI